MKNRELSILNVIISCFENCQSTIPKEINLLSWLSNVKYRARVEQLRALQDEALQKIIKASLPAITPSGLFSYRDEKHLIEHSGFLVFDIDKKDNKQISFEGLKEQVSHIPNVAFCGLSVRGQGLWGLVPIPKSIPEEHKQRFSALVKDFKAFDINLDPSGSDICRLRIYSWDPDAYFNHDAKLYTKLLKPEVKKSTRPTFSDTRERVEAIISQIKESKTDITAGYKEEWLKLGCSLANEFNESGRGYFHSISMYHPDYSIQGTDRMFDNCLKHDYNKISIGSFFKIASDYGIKIESSRRNDDLSGQQKGITKTDITVSTRREAPNVIIKPAPIKPGPWSNEITELENFFKVIPDGPIKLSQCETISDPVLFINSHLSVIKAQNGNERFLPDLDRMKELKEILRLRMN